MIRHKEGHKNSKGETAEWVIVSHKTGEIISSHKTKQEAEKHLKDIQKFKHLKENNMNLYEAKRLLESNNYIVERSTFVGTPIMFLLEGELMKLGFKTQQNHNRTKMIIEKEGITGTIFKSITGIKGTFDTGRTFKYKISRNSKYKDCEDCAKFIESIFNEEIE